MSAKYGVDEADWNSPVKDDFELDTDISAAENKEEIIERAKVGWTIKNVEAIRIGDLYLMVGVEKIIGNEFKSVNNLKKNLSSALNQSCSWIIGGKNRMRNPSHSIPLYSSPPAMKRKTS